MRAKPGQPVPPAVLQAAEDAFLKAVAELKADPSGLPPSKELDEIAAAGDAQLRAILSRNVSRFHALEELWQKFRPLAEKKPGGGRPRTAAALIVPTAPPAAPTNVIATAGNASALVSWAPPAQPVATYTVTPFIGTVAQAPIAMDGLTPFALVTGLTNGTTYTFKVRAANPLGTSPDSLPSNAVTPGAPSTTVPFEPSIPPLTAEPVLQLDPAAETARALLTEAGRIGSKWRFEYLKAQAIRAAQESLAYETHVTSLMQMTIAKATAAEQILNATLLDAAARLDQIDTTVGQISSLPVVDELVGPLSDAASDALLLPRILLFLARTSPLGFWIGMFEAMISDLASVFFSDTDFSRTRRFLRHAFETDADLKAGVQQAVNDVLQRLDEEVDRMIAPLKAAIAGVIGGTAQAMAEVFEAYDMPLLMNPPAPPSTFDVANVDPLQERAQELTSVVEQQADRLKQEIRARLAPLLATPPNGEKFMIIAMTYLVIPILAFLVISLAGGPFSAALLAAVVLIAAQELVRLILKWLTGPLLKKVDEVRRLANDLIAKLNRLFAQQADLVRNLSPELILEILANEVRELRDLLPDEFVREASALLQAARDVVLRDGLELALAAEQSLGLEHGTAFDVIRDSYLSALPKAAQLPAGTDPSLFAGAALLRDIGRLEQQRTSLQDGREIEFPVRLSLFRLLGGDPLNPLTAPGEFSRFLSTREAVVRLTEAGLVDERYPGVYRALISEVRLLGIFNAAPLGAVTGGIPVSITHLGESRTRVKRNANPAAPPLKLPECVHLTEEDFALQAASQAALEKAVERAFRTVPLATRLAYLIALLFGGAAGEAAVGRPFQKAAVESVPDAVAQRIAAELDVCGFVDPASSRERTEQILRSMTWNDVIGALLAGTTAANLNQQPPFSNLAPVITAVAQAIRTGQQGSANLKPGLEEVAREAYRAAVEAFQHRVGKWGGAYLEEDPDPQVRSLGFATLVRPMEAETAVFSLFPQTAATILRAESPAATPNGTPVGASPTLQYRPFENRGIDGRLLVRLEPGADGLSQLSDQLSDLVIEVVVRALHDKDLASTVRASRQQRRGLLALAGRLPQPARTIVIPGTRPEVQAATGELRTVHFSLRAQRDRAIDTWTAALQLDPALVPVIAGLGPLTRLGPDEPFTPLKPLGASPLNVAVSFDDAPLPTVPTEATLLDLERTVRIAPADLGFPTNVLTAGRRIVEDAKLLSMGVAVIPTQDGVRPPDTLDDAAEPIGLTLQVASLLDPLLPGFTAGATPLKKRLAMTPFAQAPAEPPAVRLVDLFNAATPPAITAAIPASVFGTPQRLYDVVFSFTFTVPTLLAATALDAIR
ncbi:MAG TPA: fibronectin type III domain-containing protein [Thermoanaerobaculia bacterium]|nr:fibronectin type III domain-containing protein [Thermoanaerobaculia bacterium]